MSIKYAILGLLDRRSMHGYELKEEFETEVGRHWSLNFGQIYTTLSRLEEKGLVANDLINQKNAPDKKVYHLTTDGKKALDLWFISPIDKIDSFKDEFYIKLMLSLASDADSRRVLHIQKKAVFHRLHELSKLKNSTDPQLQLPWVFLLDLAILHADADIRWLEMCDARLDNLAEQLEARPVGPGDVEDKDVPQSEVKSPPAERSPKVVS